MSLDDQLAELWAAGATLTQIGRQVDLSRGAVGTPLARRRLEPCLPRLCRPASMGSALRRLCFLHLAREFRLQLSSDDMRHAVILLLRDGFQPGEDFGRQANADLADGAGLGHQGAR